MKILYEASQGMFSKPIEKVEFSDKETNKFYYTQKGEAVAKTSSYRAYFVTFEEAKNFLLRKTIAKIESAQRHLDNYLKELEKIEKLTNED